jgi:anti-anti-sigma regulatory factor
MDCLVEPRTAYLLVRPVGTLDRRSSARLLHTLRKCFAEQPDAVIVDLSRMAVAEGAALAAFPAMAEQAARWPGIPFVLCSPLPAVAPMFGGAVFRAVRICPTLDDAESSLGGGPATPMLVENLLPVAGAGRRAREVVTEACARWELPQLTGPACIVATELVGNAAVHAGTMIELRVTLRPRQLHLSVYDGSPDPPRRMPFDQRGGRGLLLVDAVALSWGYLFTGDGKVVWATLPRAGG